MSRHISELSNLLLAVPFVYALLYPERSIEFIYDTGVMLLVFEIFSIISTMAIEDYKNKPIKDKFALFLFFMVFVYSFIKSTQSPQIWYFFTVSLITKFFIFRTAPSIAIIARPMLVLLATSTFIIATGWLWKFLIPLPEEVMRYGVGKKGLFNEIPQTLLAWGIIYPVGLYLTNFIKFPVKIGNITLKI